MALNIWTGFHWCSPVDPNNSAMAKELLQKTSRWGTVILCYPSSQGSANGDFTDACSRALSAVTAAGGSDLSECIARLYFPSALTINNPGQPNNIASVADADNWLKTNGFYDSLNAFISSPYNGRMCVVFNELNESTEPQHNIDPRIMGYLGYALQNAYWNGGNRLLYTLFPGPTGLLGSQSAFDNYFRANYSVAGGNGYDLWFNGSGPLSFGQWAADYGLSIDSTVADRTMLHHGGSGVFDRVALHCYAGSPSEFQNPSVSGNQALQYIQWLLGIDSSGWIYVTEASGSDSYDDYNEGVALADFEYNVSSLNSQPISAGGFGEQVQAVYGYILDISNASASRNGIDRFSCHATDGYNYERGQLGF